MTSLVRAGAETQLVDLINGIDSSCFETTLVIFKKNTDQLVRIDRRNVDFFQLIREYKFDVRVILKLAALIRAKNPDAIHCTNQFTMALAWMATKLVRVKPKLLVTLHTTKNIRLRYEIFERTLYRWMMRQVDCVIFVCFTQANYWQSKYSEIKRKSVMIYNGVDTDFFDPVKSEDSAKSLRASLGINPNEFVVASIAAFRPEKAHALLIRAFSQLEGKPHLVLAGEGKLRAEIENQVKRLRLQNRVHFLGNIEDVRPVLMIADITVLSSTAVETFSIAMLESMAMETPVVATDVGGLREAVIPKKTGYLLAAGGVSDLKNALSEAISNRNKIIDLGANARRMVVEKFSTAEMIEKNSTILCRVINGVSPVEAF